MTTNRKKKLSPDETIRLDALLSAARNFHYTSFALAGLSLALSSLERVSDLSLPTIALILPNLQSVVGIYLLVIVFVLAADRLYTMAHPWLEFDNRRPQFAWVALGTYQTNELSVILWLTIPLIICAFATANMLAKIASDDIAGFGLSFISILIVFVTHQVSDYWTLIKERRDHRGGPATFSIYLLYWIRLIRTIVSTIFFILPVFAVIPSWRSSVITIVGYSFSALLTLQAMSLIGGISFIYRFIDRVGQNWDFPTKSKHYI